jgi:hypothetical protein
MKSLADGLPGEIAQATATALLPILSAINGQHHCFRTESPPAMVGADAQTPKSLAGEVPARCRALPTFANASFIAARISSGVRSLMCVANA